VNKTNGLGRNHIEMLGGESLHVSTTESSVDAGLGYKSHKPFDSELHRKFNLQAIVKFREKGKSNIFSYRIPNQSDTINLLTFLSRRGATLAEHLHHYHFTIATQRDTAIGAHG
jgi:hypothetical protein